MCAPCNTPSRVLYGIANTSLESTRELLWERGYVGTRPLRPSIPVVGGGQHDAPRDRVSRGVHVEGRCGGRLLGGMHNTAPAERYSVKAVFAARGTQTTSATTDSSRRRPLLSPAPYSRGVNLIETGRLVLRRWREDDKEPFAALNADPVVMEHFPATLTREESDTFVERIEAAFEERGFGLWAVEADGVFIGFTGLQVPRFTAHFTPCVEIGWRLARSAWGHGYATEAARAALEHGFGTLGLTEVVSFTAVPNVRSQAVMRRLGMTRDPGEDFDHPVLPEGHPLRRHVLYRARRPAC